MPEITGKTPLFGLIGHPVRHSISPTLHNAWFRHHGIDGMYAALPTREPAGDILTALTTLGVSGVNVTVPLKRDMLPLVDALDEDATLTGAINTLVRDGRDWVGHNTDVAGFSAALAELGVDPHGARVAVLGAGGAALGVAAALLRAGAEGVVLYNRDEAKAHRLAARLGGAVCGGPLTTLGFSALTPDLVVNALPGAARERVRALPIDHLPQTTAWVDLNYWDPEPPHLQTLRARGHRVQTGHLMLLHQAALAFARFTGVSPAIEVGRALLPRQSAAMVTEPAGM